LGVQDRGMEAGAAPQTTAMRLHGGGLRADDVKRAVGKAPAWTPRIPADSFSTRQK
jgi:hypothetical protein